MSKTSLADEIITIVRSEANKNPAPTKATITKVYSDGYADVTFTDGSLNYVKVIGLATVGDAAVILWLDESMTDYIVVTGSIQTLDDLKERHMSWKSCFSRMSMCFCALSIMASAQQRPYFSRSTFSIEPLLMPILIGT